MVDGSSFAPAFLSAALCWALAPHTGVGPTAVLPGQQRARAVPSKEVKLLLMAEGGFSCCLALAAEFNRICSKTAIGFVVMGFIGFFVKLIFIVSPQPPGGTPQGWLSVRSTAAVGSMPAV